MSAKDIPITCFYCSKIIDCDGYLHCHACENDVHVKCLKRKGTPGDLSGDVFFTFTCYKCATDETEVFARQKLPWLMIVTIAIYNLSVKSKGLSRHGFFHWRAHIVHFIDKYWNFLFDPTTRRKKKWVGTVSGALSHNSPEFFTSGLDFFQETGWWKLTHNQTPKFYFELYEKISLKRQQMRMEKRNLEESYYSSDDSIPPSDQIKRIQNESEIENNCSRTRPFVGKNNLKPLKQQPIEPQTELTDDTNFSTVQSNLMDFLAANLSTDDLLFNDEISNMNSKDDLLPLLNIPSESDDCSYFNVNSSHLFESEGSPAASANENLPSEKNNASESDDENMFCPRIIQVTNFQQIDNNTFENKNEVFIDDTQNATEEADDDLDDVKDYNLVCEKSLFTKTLKRTFPWVVKENGESTSLSDEEEECDLNRISVMSEYEEKELYHKLKNLIRLGDDGTIDIPVYIRRFYRKLVVRETKRKYCRPIFNIDSLNKKNHFRDLRPQILDRYHSELLSNSGMQAFNSFYARIAGNFYYEVFESPYTSRRLHPFIYKNSDCFPPWLKLMCEVQYAVNGIIPSRSTIDFAYVRPNHIAAVNTLLQTAFWPGIDMSECLSYPDFSVVALYKKLIVGCAFLVPDVGFNEAYISFMAVRSGWQRSSIASFMLYHLVQTCMTKDITLHVSASNPAVCLYQKFGFKIEEVILDFYEKYLPIDSKHSRHAFFLRLKR